MKKITIIVLAFVGMIFSSCIKNDDIIFTGSVVEFDAAVYNANSTGVTYPILTRLPGYGRAAITSGATADPSITRTSGAIKFRVNLVGRQRSTPQVIGVSVDAASTALSGVHYSVPATVTIPANSSFGELTVTVINTGVSSTTARVLVLDLQGNGEIGASANDRRLGISIAQN